jgi:hypothetical protein
MKRILILQALISLLVAGPAIAKDGDMCGEYTSVDIGETRVEMGSKTTFIHFRSATQMFSSEGSRFHQLSGQCTGGAMVYSDGSVEADGLCAVEDTEGDVLTYAFTQGRTAREGKFTRKGGTGKFANARETGWYKPISLNGEVTTGNWGGKGTCK